MVAGAKVWNGTAWVDAVGSGGSPAPSWFSIAQSWRVSGTDAGLGGPSITPPATAHTLGTWVQLSSSLPVDADALHIGVTSAATGVDRALMFDIGTGAAGAETVRVAGVPIADSTAIGVATVPVRIAAGTRVAIRVQARRASAAASTWGLQLLALPSSLSTWMPTSVDVLGSNQADSRGTNLPTNGAWTQIVASTSRAYKMIALCPSTTDTTMANSFAAFDLGVGAAGSEVAYLGPTYRPENNESMQHPIGSSLIAVDVPAGTRLAARYVDPSASNAGYTCSLIGVPA
jgi:hypothetical protein